MTHFRFPRQGRTFWIDSSVNAKCNLVELGTADGCRGVSLVLLNGTVLRHRWPGTLVPWESKKGGVVPVSL